MKVLLGVDGSGNSGAAAVFLTRLLDPKIDRVILYSALPEIGPETIPNVDDKLRARAGETIIHTVFEMARKNLGVSLAESSECIHDSQPSAAGLLEAASTHDVDMICVGFRGLGVFQRMMLGSVSRAVVQSAPCPVLVVRNSTDSTPDEPESPLNCLVAYDGSTIGKQLPALLDKLSFSKNSTGKLMQVVEPLSTGHLPKWLTQHKRDAEAKAMADAWREEYESEVEVSERQLKVYQQKLPDVFKQSPPVVIQGHATEEILSAIEKESIDLVVLGSRGRNPLTNLLLGSTTDAVLASAQCSVLVVRPQR